MQLPSNKTFEKNDIQKSHGGYPEPGFNFPDFPSGIGVWKPLDGD